VDRANRVLAQMQLSPLATAAAAVSRRCLTAEPSRSTPLTLTQHTHPS